VVGEQELTRAYAHCERLAREHYENFPVASRLLPPAMRPHIAAIYVFARTADDFADAPGIPDRERLTLLDQWGVWLSPGSDLDFCAVGSDVSTAGSDLDFCAAPQESRSDPKMQKSRSDPVGAKLIFTALHNTIAQHRLPVTLFEDLLSAFKQDVTTKRYATWADLLDYCRRSANPVGRLVLRVAGYDDERLNGASDAVCTALQLTNFWQDLQSDWSIGRLYVPREDRDRVGAREEDLARNTLTAEWRSVLRSLSHRTRDLFAAGRSVCDGVRGRLRWELRLTWLGGSRILDKLERSEFDVFRSRPALSAADAPGLVRDAILWRPAR
jgi:squalene synthase HpnC